MINEYEYEGPSCRCDGEKCAICPCGKPMCRFDECPICGEPTCLDCDDVEAYHQQVDEASTI